VLLDDGDEVPLDLPTKGALLDEAIGDLKDPVSGQRVEITGELKKGGKKGDKIKPKAVKAKGGNLKTKSRRAAVGMTLGNRNAVLILVQFPDANAYKVTAADMTAAENTMWNK